MMAAVTANKKITPHHKIKPDQSGASREAVRRTVGESFKDMKLMARDLV